MHISPTHYRPVHDPRPTNRSTCVSPECDLGILSRQPNHAQEGDPTDRRNMHISPTHCRPVHGPRPTSRPTCVSAGPPS